MIIKEAYKETLEYLRDNNILDFSFETRIIFEDLLHYPPSSIHLQQNNGQHLTSHEIQILHNCLTQRITGKPLAHIIGQAFFWNNLFLVNEHTLIPRQDTETMVAEILKLYPNQQQALNILDLGTGSGCIILSLLEEYANSQGIAVDISHHALEIAQKNAINLKLSDRITFIHSDWFTQLADYKGKFHIILSNPPYIDVNDPHIDQNVKQFEPPTALYAKNNGLEFYETIIQNAPNFLAPSAHLILEIGWKQWHSIQNMAQKHNFSSHLVKDMSNNPRCVLLSHHP